MKSDFEWYQVTQILFTRCFAPSLPKPFHLLPHFRDPAIVQVPNNFYKYSEINRLLFLPEFQGAECKKENFKDFQT